MIHRRPEESDYRHGAESYKPHRNTTVILLLDTAERPKPLIGVGTILAFEVSLLDYLSLNTVATSQIRQDTKEFAVSCFLDPLLPEKF